MKPKTLFYLISLTFVISLIPAAYAQTFSVIHAFTVADGVQPATGVTIRGNALYGTLINTSFKDSSCGAVYQLTQSGSNWLFSDIAFLSKNSCNPEARVVFGPDGHLYGTTATGPYLFGAVFKLTPQVGPCKDLRCLWAVNVLHQFSSDEGYEPSNGDLIWDQQGNIYNTTVSGGAYVKGTVYQLTPSGNGYTESVLYSFSGPDGATPFAGLVLDNQGNLFGTTTNGGSNDDGTVFELTYVVGVGWTEHVLHNFQNGSDGESPIGGLMIDSSGNLYGTTRNGGSGGGGTVFELSPSGDTWTFQILHSLSGAGYCGPFETLTMDGTGNLYGTTACAGLYNSGSVFKLSNTENGWVYTSLHDFTGSIDGGVQVLSNVAIDLDGTLYGTTVGGGDMSCDWGSGCGVVWMIKP